MWKDLADRTETLKISPFVRHMIDTPREAYGNGARFLEPRTIDDTINPADLMAPLNADSSQMVAIHASGQGGDFVLEGPPGTGKSETIGNIIAHNIGLGRRVLFVSEKMAALEVVYRRLRECGLGDFCLELHSAKANKRAVVEQLGAAWAHRSAYASADWQNKAAELAALRRQLNGLVEALHALGPTGISPRDAMGRSLRYGDVHRLELGWERDDQGLGHAPTPEDLRRLEDIAKQLAQQFGQLEPDDFMAFEDIGHTDWSYAWQSDIAAQAQRLGTRLTNLIEKRRSFTERLGIAEVGDSLEESGALAQIAALVPDCATTNTRYALEGDGREMLATLEETNRLLFAYRTSSASLTAACSDARILDMPIAGWIAERDRVMQKRWPFRAFALGQLRKAMRVHFRLTKAQARQPEVDLDVLCELAGYLDGMTARSRRLPDHTPWNGLATDCESARREIETAKHLREAASRLESFSRDPLDIRTQLVRVLCDGRDLLESGMPIATAAKALVDAQAAFISAFDGFRSVAGLEREETSLVQLGVMVATLAARERRLNLWCRWIEISREARAAGLGALVEALRGGSVAPEQAVEAFKTAYCRWLAPILVDARPELQRFSSVQHEDLLRTFRNVDRELTDVTADYIRATLSGQAPDMSSGGADPGYGVLSRELQKRTRFKPVRQLVSEMGDALLTLTPCLLMSPLSVGQFLPADQQPFDLVIFDEASQITVPDAIGAIARGKNCIIVGDPKQMPPTRFFEKGAEDDENEEARDLESILDEALAARVPHHRLTGHYRSRHESLICFSNHAYYQGALVTYPTADTRDTAISFHRVDGVYAKGRTRTNEIEAKAVVAEIVRRLRDPGLSALSIGVVTFNSEQQRLIEDLLDHERRADPDLERFFGPDRQEPVFVKNLETVQGDQRDVILLSVGYGPTEPGAQTMSMNFGPLNRQGGERRLNVAITRATTEALVFASFDASMIDLTRTSAQGVQDLKHYIDFAARGPVALGEAIRSFGGTSGYDSDFEEAVAEGLRRHGWTIRTQVGVSKFRIDLGVVHPDTPGRFLAGVECDGATYHSSPSARDRDRIRQIILERLGWRLLRVWSTDFFLDPEASIENLHTRLTVLLEEDRVAETEAANARATMDNPEPFTDEAIETEIESNADDDDEEDDRDENASRDMDESTSDVTEQDNTDKQTMLPLRPAPDELTPDPSRFYDPEYQNHLREMAAMIINHEGPITFKRLTDQLARAHGFRRTGRPISQLIWNVCEQVRPKSQSADGHHIFWPEGSIPKDIVPFRGMQVGGTRREWRDVPYPEKLGLIRDVLSTSPSDPARSVGDAIGISRLTTTFRNEITELISAMSQL
jgi:very-short-patch-repair endonuclease